MCMSVCLFTSPYSFHHIVLEKSLHTEREDQSPRGAVNRVKYHMGERADELLKKRIMIIKSVT